MKLKNLIEITTSSDTGPETVRLDINPDGTETRHLTARVSRFGSVMRRPLFDIPKKRKKKKKKKKKEK